jgi:fibronectin type 3 domain-containing protein
MAMGYVSLSWTPVNGAKRYNIYRDGVRYLSGVVDSSYKDMGVVSGKKYTYTVSSVGASGMEGPRSAPASATVPNPPSPPSMPTTPGQAFIPPANLRVTGLWQPAAGPTDRLTWDPAPGAVSYNVYRYDVRIAQGVTGTSYTIPAASFLAFLTYTVTANDAMGMESIPSNTVTAQGALDPSVSPSWMPAAPSVPLSVVATPEWNNGAPRIHVTWRGNMAAYTYNVYRDGSKVATGLWGQHYYDTSVKPGESHIYSVTAENLPWTTPVESALTAPVLAVAPTAVPAKPGQPVTITGIKLNDDSALISFNGVAGAADYRIYNTANPGVMKYSGGSLSIEMNGLDPAQPATLVVEAVDKMGPFQIMDGEMGPGAMGMDGKMRYAINGQGDPSNVPNVLTASAPFTVTPGTAPRLTGDQIFFDTFRGSQPLVPGTVPQPLMTANSGQVSALENNKWTILNVQGDMKSTRSFLMSNHFMDTLYDGGTWGVTNVIHNNNAVLIMQPKAVADISGGRVLHVTFEVDAHFDGRRWCEVIVAGADDPLLNPGKFAETNMMPTASGKIFRWQIMHTTHHAQLFDGQDSAGQLIYVPLFDTSNGVGPDNYGPPARIGWDQKPVWNGTTQDIDKRHRFDLYLSQNRFQVYEEGTLIKDKVFPDGATLPFTNPQIYFLHKVYHTGNDRPELVEWSHTEHYWINHRPWADERHWDNMGFEVLKGFPAAPQILP